MKFSLFGRTWEDTVAQFYEGTQEDLDRMDQTEAWLKARFGDRVSVFRAAPLPDYFRQVLDKLVQL